MWLHHCSVFGQVEVSPYIADRMQQINFDDGITNILEKDSRYAREAYEFLREALEFTQQAVKSGRKTKARGKDSLPKELLNKSCELERSNHITGEELLMGIREYALAMFGPMALTVFEQWGVKSCMDIGNMVFLMVEHNLLRKTQNDSPEDFKKGYDFEEAFRAPFLPEKKKGISQGENSRELEKN